MAGNSRGHILSLIVVFLAFTVSAGAADWPVKGSVDLSNAFGEYRLNRFHVGVDIRTGGQVGTKVYSPVDGYVWRIRTAYDGYGKGLYIKDATGHIYVFGHLDGFAPKLDSLVKNIQDSSRRYYQDLYFSQDSIKVSKGELIALSGNTGTSGPHLHFELRNPDNQTLNPLLHNFKLRDMEPPAFERITFKMTDNRSLFDNSERTLEFKVGRGKNKLIYRLDTLLYFNKPFGVLATALDRTRRGGMPLTPYLMGLLYDDVLQYEVVMDTIDFDHQRFVNLEYEIVSAAQGDKRTRRLYHSEGNEFTGSRGRAPGGGVFGSLGYETYGLHRGKIAAMDHAGNITELVFSFVWGPDEFLYQLDSTLTDGSSRVTYFLTPGIHRHHFPVDSVVAMEKNAGRWVKSPSSRVTYQEQRKVVLETERPLSGRTGLRLNVYSLGCEIPDIVLADISDKTPENLSVKHEVIDDGLLVKIDTDVSGLVHPAVELYSGDYLLGVEYAGFYRGNYAAFIAPQDKYRHIDRIVCRLSGENAAAQASVDASIYLVGMSTDTIKAGDRYALNFTKDNFYQPRFIELRLDENKPGYLRILPEAFVCRSNFLLTADFSKSANPKQEGVCWRDTKAKNWAWLENKPATDAAISSLTGGGSFEIFADTKPPEIRQLNVSNGLTYSNPLLEINFLLVDSLSGIQDDRNILIELDGVWMIPEYHPSTKMCKTAPLKPLADGRHELKIVVTDRVGNQSEKKLHFFIKAQNQ